MLTPTQTQASPPALPLQHPLQQTIQHPIQPPIQQPLQQPLQQHLQQPLQQPLHPFHQSAQQQPVQQQLQHQNQLQPQHIQHVQQVQQFQPAFSHPHPGPITPISPLPYVNWEVPQSHTPQVYPNYPDYFTMVTQLPNAAVSPIQSTVSEPATPAIVTPDVDLVMVSGSGCAHNLTSQMDPTSHVAQHNVVPPEHRLPVPPPHALPSSPPLPLNLQ